jgi:hypothetical protein
MARRGEARAQRRAIAPVGKVEDADRAVRPLERKHPFAAVIRAAVVDHDHFELIRKVWENLHGAFDERTDGLPLVVTRQEERK